MKKIPLTQGKFALVDDEDYVDISQWRWNYNQGYAVHTKCWRENGEKKRKTIGMHRQINGNGDTVDNRRCNLRSCDQRDNTRNRRKSENKSSVFKGVSWHKRHERWQAGIKLDGKVIYLGMFNDEVDAALAYNFAAVAIQGEFAKFNKAAA